MSLNPILDIIFFIVRLCNNWRSIMVNVLKCEAWVCNEQCSGGQSIKLRSHGIKNRILYQLILFIHLQVIQFLNLFFSSRAKFPSSNLWVMGPPQFHYATLIYEEKDDLLWLLLQVHLWILSSSWACLLVLCMIQYVLAPSVWQSSVFIYTKLR